MAAPRQSRPGSPTSLWAGLDALATPTLGCPVPLPDAVELDYRSELGWYTAPFSALNLPAIAADNLQVVGRTEVDVLTIARAREDAGYPRSPCTSGGVTNWPNGDTLSIPH